MKFTSVFYFFFWLLLGILVGSLAANLCAGVPGLSWLAYGQSFTLSPAFDVILLKLDMTLTMSLNLAQALFVALAMFIYYHFWY